MKRLMIFFCFAFIALMATLTSACSSETEIPMDEPQNETMSVCHVPLSIQQQNLSKIFSDPQIAESVLGTQTRASLRFNNVQSFDRKGNPLTRAQEEDAYYYLFDLDGQGNYALMGANTTVPPLLAIVNKDKNITDEMRKLIADDVPALANFPESLNGVVIDGGGEISTTDTLIKVYDYKNAQFQLMGRRPLTNKWNQWAPFSDMMPSCYNYNENHFVPHAAVGCAPLAAAMIMCDPIYNIKPYKGLTFNWSKMLQYETMNLEATDASFQGVASYDFPKLFETLTSSENNNFEVSELGEYSTWTWNSGAARTFRNFGLSNSGLEPYDSLKMVQALKEGYPLYISGYSDSEVKNKQGGHAWVCSAVLKATVPVTYIFKSQLSERIPETAVWISEEKVLFHHNFGWGGNCNGYYYIDMRINTGLGVVLNDNFTPNTKRPKDNEWWGDYNNSYTYFIINKNQ